jgi:hypothetical protein
MADQNGRQGPLLSLVLLGPVPRSPQKAEIMTLPQVDEPRLETDTGYRFGYLCEFIGFGNDDINAIHAAAAFLGPRVPGLVDAVYDKLFAYDATKRHFVPRQSGYEGPLPTGIDGEYLDLVGKIHTPAAGSRDLDVPLVQMNALMGFVATALTATILSLGLERDTEKRTVLAFEKLLWIQNDLISRHYEA